MPFPGACFDTVTASCVFCSVTDPVQGLREARRVVRPDGQVLLYEHVRPGNPVMGKVADWISPWSRRAFGPELNRLTESNTEQAGLVLAEVHARGIWRAMVATPG